MVSQQAQPPAAAEPGEDDGASALQRRNADLAQAVLARDAFIAVAAHELRNPMTPIMGQIDFLLRLVRDGRCTPEQVEQRLGRVQRAMRHYMKRSAVLLDVSRITSGRLRLELEPFDLAVLVREIAGDFADAAGRAGVAVTVTAPDHLPVRLDRLALEQVVDNLLSNAIKYGGRTPVEMFADAGDGRLLIRVRDRGPGIPDNERERVFQQFERVIGQDERRSGFGVGLWVVRQLVEAMYGTITIGDAPGGGAMFTVALPLDMKDPVP